MVTAVIEAALRGSALLAMMWIVLMVIRLRDLAAQKNAWTLIAAASLAMPFLSRAAVLVAPPLAVLPMRTHALPAAVPEVLHGMHAGLTTLPIAQASTFLYLLGMTAMMLRFAIGLGMGAKMRHHAVKLANLSVDGLDVRVSPLLRGPASFASTILLPPTYRSWDQPMLTAVLAHEQAHILNRDCYRLWLVALYRAVFWFNPLAHLLYRHLHMLSELTSDDAAAATLGDRSGYAEVLRRVASQQPRFAAIVAMATPSTLSRRLRMLAHDPGPVARIGLRHTVMLTCAVLMLIALVAIPTGRATAVAAEQVAHLELYLADVHANASRARESGKIPAGDRLLYDENGQPVLLKRESLVSNSALQKVSTKQKEYGTVVEVKFDKQAGASILRATRANIGNRMVVVYVDHNGADRVVSDAFIRGQFSTTFEISGLSPEEAQSLAAQLDHAVTR
jgi:beta-lactamase regulating signal transducer with metallopeptidase domain